MPTGRSSARDIFYPGVTVFSLGLSACSGPPRFWLGMSVSSRSVPCPSWLGCLGSVNPSTWPQHPTMWAAPTSWSEELDGQGVEEEEEGEGRFQVSRNLRIALFYHDLTTYLFVVKFCPM